MISMLLHGASSVNYGLAVKSALSTLKDALELYHNITFVEMYKVNDEVDRYIFEIDGYDNFYLALQNVASYNSGLQMRIYLKQNVYTETVKYTMAISATSKTEQGIYYVDFYVNLLSKNKILKALTMYNTTTSPSYYIGFSGKYVYAEFSVCDNDTGVTYNISTQQLPTYILAEKALVKNAIITNGDASTSSFVDILDDMYYFINSQFSTMTRACIEVDGVKYRQILRNYLFIEDGDTE